MRRIVALAGISLLLGAACGGGEDTGSAPNSAGGQGEAEASVSVASMDLGDALVGENGRTLYMLAGSGEERHAHLL